MRRLFNIVNVIGASLLLIYVIVKDLFFQIDPVVNLVVLTFFAIFLIVRIVMLIGTARNEKRESG